MRFFPVFVLLLLLLLHESRGWDKCRKKLDKCVTKIWRSGGYKGKFEHPSPNHQVITDFSFVIPYMETGMFPPSSQQVVPLWTS